MAEEISPYKAQFGEDKLLAKYFGHKKTGVYVEVGALDGVIASNTFYFEQLGWQGLLIEAIPEMAERCRQQRPNATVINCAVVALDAPAQIEFEVVKGWEAISAIELNRERLHGFMPEVKKISVQAKPLDQILTESGIGKIDFMTIDVEGHEWDVLQGFSLKSWQPHILILERWKPVPEQKIMNYMHSAGYQYMRTTGGLNDWFQLATPAGTRALSYRTRLFLQLYAPAYIKQTAKQGAIKTMQLLGLRKK